MLFTRSFNKGVGLTTAVVEMVATGGALVVLVGVAILAWSQAESTRALIEIEVASLSLVAAAILGVSPRFLGLTRHASVRGALLTGVLLAAMTSLLLLVRRSTWVLSPATQAIGLLVLAVLVFGLLSRPWFRARHIGLGTNLQLGWTRAVVCASLLMIVYRFDIVTTLSVPTDYLRLRGPLRFLFEAPFLFDLRSQTLLIAIRWTALISLGCAVFGLLGRLAVVVAAISFTFFYYIQISYTHFFHTGFMPLEMLYVLCFLPCTDGFRLPIGKKTKATVKNATYGGALFACAVVYCLSYYAAGMSKWFTDPFWGTGSNLLSIFAVDSLSHIDHVLGLNLVPEYLARGYPRWVFTPLAWGGIALETSAPLFLFYRRSWRWLPLAFFVFHLGVYLGQKFTFFECALLAFAFLDIEPIIDRCVGRRPSAAAAPPEPQSPTVPLAVAALFSSLILAGWCYDWEIFPLATNWAVYSGRHDLRTVYYPRIWAVTAGGVRFVTDLTDQFTWIGAPYWKDLVFLPRDRDPMILGRVNRLLANYARLYNAGRPADAKVVRFELERVAWNYQQQSASGPLAVVDDRVDFPLATNSGE